MKRRWTQDLLSSTYSLTDLMTTASKTYNNIVVDGGWTLSEKKTSVGSIAKDSKEAKFLELSTQIKALTKCNYGGRPTGTGIYSGPEGASWRFTNLDNKKKLEKKRSDI